MPLHVDLCYVVLCTVLCIKYINVKSVRYTGINHKKNYLKLMQKFVYILSLSLQVNNILLLCKLKTKCERALMHCTLMNIKKCLSSFRLDLSLLMLPLYHHTSEKVNLWTNISDHTLPTVSSLVHLLPLGYFLVDLWEITLVT